MAGSNDNDPKKGKCNGRRSGRKNRNKNKREVRTRVSGLMKNTKPLIPVVILSESQWNKLKPHTSLVELQSVEKDDAEHCLRFAWKEKFRGGSFSQDLRGAIVAEADSLTSNSVLGHHLLCKKNIQYFGEAFVAGNGAKALIALWNCDSTTNNENLPVCVKELLKEIHAIKPNIMAKDGTKHHGSCGKAYGYGSRASYTEVATKTDLNSISQYACKKVLSGKASKIMEEMKKRLGAPDATNLDLNKLHEQCIIEWLQEGVATLDGVFANTTGVSVVRSGTLPNEVVVKAMHLANSNLTQHIHFLGETKFPSSYMNVNAQTLRSHTEEDVSMTLIYVMPQEWLKPDEQSPTTFNFYPTSKESEDCISIQLKVGMAVLFSGFWMVHRQQCHNNQHTFVNVSAYGNKRLHGNCQRTIQRNS